MEEDGVGGGGVPKGAERAQGHPDGAPDEAEIPEPRPVSQSGPIRSIKRPQVRARNVIPPSAHTPRTTGGTTPEAVGEPLGISPNIEQHQGTEMPSGAATNPPVANQAQAPGVRPALKPGNAFFPKSGSLTTQDTSEGASSPLAKPKPRAPKSVMFVRPQRPQDEGPHSRTPPIGITSLFGLPKSTTVSSPGIKQEEVDDLTPDEIEIFQNFSTPVLRSEPVRPRFPFVAFPPSRGVHTDSHEGPAGRLAPSGSTPSRGAVRKQHQLDVIGETTPPAPPAPPAPRPNAIQTSVIMCMDPTCNKCPPEMHALRNRKLMEKMKKSKSKEFDDDDDEDEDSDATTMEQMPKLSLEEELEQELDETMFADELFESKASKNDPEQGRRMIIRICGFKIVMKRSGRKPFWLKGYRFLKDVKTSLIFNPNNAYIRKWNMLFVFAAMLGFFFDPLFFFIFTAIYSPNQYLCITINWTPAIVSTVIVSFVQFWYLLHILITFRTAYVVPAPREDWWTGKLLKDPSGKAPGELVFDGRLIARNYVNSGRFFLDLLSTLPLPQILMLAVVPQLTQSTASAVLIGLIILLQVIPRSLRLALKFVDSAAEHQEQGLLDSAWGQFALNLLLYLIAAHIVGSIWYLFSVQRVQVCLQTATGVPPSLLYCPQGDSTLFPPSPLLTSLTAPSNSSNPAPYDLCLGNNINSVEWGIFYVGMNRVGQPDFFSRYLSSLYWGFQQLSTIAGNQVPSPWVAEIIFILLVSCVGLLLLALLIGNMSNFLQALSRKSFEYQMNKRDVQLWMYRRNIPNKLQRKVNALLRLQWATTRGVEDNEVLPLLTEDMQRDLRRRLCVDLLTVSPLFEAVNPQVLDAFCERLQQRIYIDGTIIVKEGYPVSRLFFVLKGEVIRTSNRTGYIDRDSMSTGDFVGEEVLVQYMDKYTKKSGSLYRGSSSSRWTSREDFGRNIGRTITRTGPRGVTFNISPTAKRQSSDSMEQELDVLPTSRFTALCVGPVEGYSLEARDVEAVCRQYWKQLQTEKVQLALNRCSRARKVHHARTIQLAWRRYLRRKYQLSMRDCIDAAMERRMGKLLTVKRSESVSRKTLEEAMSEIEDEEEEDAVCKGEGEEEK